MLSTFGASWQKIYPKPSVILLKIMPSGSAAIDRGICFIQGTKNHTNSRKKGVFALYQAAHLWYGFLINQLELQKDYENKEKQRVKTKRELALHWASGNYTHLLNNRVNYLIVYFSPILQRIYSRFSYTSRRLVQAQVCIYDKAFGIKTWCGSPRMSSGAFWTEGFVIVSTQRRDNKMLKKISRKSPLLLAVCLAFALILAGCGGSGSPASDSPPAGPATGYCGCGGSGCQSADDCSDFNCTTPGDCICDW